MMCKCHLMVLYAMFYFGVDKSLKIARTVCQFTGRKNTEGERPRIRDLIEKRRREGEIIKKSRTEFSTAHISEESEQSDSDKHENLTEGNIQFICSCITDVSYTWH